MLLLLPVSDEASFMISVIAIGSSHAHGEWSYYNRMTIAQHENVPLNLRCTVLIQLLRWSVCVLMTKCFVSRHHVGAWTFGWTSTLHNRNTIPQTVFSSSLNGPCSSLSQNLTWRKMWTRMLSFKINLTLSGVTAILMSRLEIDPTRWTLPDVALARAKFALTWIVSGSGWNSLLLTLFDNGVSGCCEKDECWMWSWDSGDSPVTVVSPPPISALLALVTTTCALAAFAFWLGIPVINVVGSIATRAKGTECFREDEAIVVDVVSMLFVLIGAPESEQDFSGWLIFKWFKYL